MNMDQQHLVDDNLDKIIMKCFINKKHSHAHEVFVIYVDDTRETIWTFDPIRYDLSPREFVGKTKIEAVFYCDRKCPRSMQLF